MERVLHDREDALGGLVESLSKRAQDVDAMMRNYMDHIEESLSTAETRSAEIGKLMAQHTTSAAKGLEQEIRKIGGLLEYADRQCGARDARAA